MILQNFTIRDFVLGLFSWTIPAKVQPMAHTVPTFDEEKFDLQLLAIVKAAHRITNIGAYITTVRALDVFQKHYEPMMGWMTVQSSTDFVLAILEEKQLKFYKESPTLRTAAIEKYGYKLFAKPTL